MTIPVVGVGTSAGGVAAILALAKALPDNFPGAILTVCHTTPQGPSLLPKLLSARSRMRVCAAEQDMKIERGTHYVALPDRHLMLEGDHLRLTRGPRENHTRPAI